MKKIILIMTLLFGSMSFAQNFDSKAFLQKMDLATQLIHEQPNSEEVFESDEYSVYGVDVAQFIIEDTKGQFYTLQLNIETLEIVYIEIELNKNIANDLFDFLSRKRFGYIGSEHLWNYYQTKEISFSATDAFEDKVVIHVSKLYEQD